MSSSDVSDRHEHRLGGTPGHARGCGLDQIRRSTVRPSQRDNAARDHARQCDEGETRSRAASHLSEWLQKLRHDHAARILAVTDQIAVEWGRLSALRPRDDSDGLIAATAIVHDLIIATRNVADFDETRATVLNPWDKRAR